MNTKSPNSIKETDFDIGFAVKLWTTVTIKAKNFTDAEIRAKELSLNDVLNGEPLDYVYNILQIHDAEKLKKLGL